MTFRTRPILDRRHRPRWQDELRTQQLVVAAFAIAIALALGIFGAARWNAYWEAHLRPVVAVAGTVYDRAHLTTREQILVAETVAELSELQAQLGGPRDPLIQQQMDALNQSLSALSATAAESLLDAAVLESRADEFGVSVSDEEVDAALAERFTLPERLNARLILVEALPDEAEPDAEPDAEPTEAQLQAAREEAAAARERVGGGEDFAAVAADVSDDFTAESGGALGWFEADDPAYGEYVAALAGASVGDLVGPIETDRGFVVLELVDRRPATSEGGVRQGLRAVGIDEATYREYVRGELLVDEFREYFTEEVATSPAPQQRVAQIVIRPVSGEVMPQQRARHVLIAPLPDAQDQSAATDEQWAAALEEAREVRELVTAEDADWFEIAEEHSDDPGSGVRGGDLGWSDPDASPYVPEFGEALNALEIGEVSEPVRTDFGWHIIQKTDVRDSPQQQAQRLVRELRADPDAFAETAAMVSEDPETARDGGELGWVAPYQLERTLEDAVFALGDVGEISEPVVAGDGTITIYQLLEASDSREIEPDRLEQIHDAGFERWLDEEVRAPVQTWVDSQFASTTTA